MALYQDGILISGANTLPKMTLAEYNALPADQRPTYWERLDADYDDVLAPKTDIATVESGATASRAYSVGELVYVSGTLYRVKTAIASGATFTVGTNIEATSVSNACKSSIQLTNITCNNGSFTGNVYIKNGVAFINLTITRTNASLATTVTINGLNAVESTPLVTTYMGWQPEQQSQQATVITGNRLTIQAGGFTYVNVSVAVIINQ